jgi:2-C-methyl-D-erythritol 2,4-cyclodiphosphate synthase
MNDDKQTELPPYRIGHGYDVHRFGEGDHIVLGGVKIAHQYGFIAHSDGDVLIHALCDAMLGAIAAGDIGRHFPDTDERYKNIDSSVLLDSASQMVNKAGYAIGNVDLTIIAQSPKMAPYIPAMTNNLCSVLNIEQARINIKATTTESLGFAGREEGIAVHSVVMLYRFND